METVVITEGTKYDSNAPSSRAETMDRALIVSTQTGKDEVMTYLEEQYPHEPFELVTQDVVDLAKTALTDNPIHRYPSRTRMLDEALAHAGASSFCHQPRFLRHRRRHAGPASTI